MYCAYKHIPSNYYIVLYKESDIIYFKCIMNKIVYKTSFFHKLFSESWKPTSLLIDIEEFEYFKDFELIFETLSMNKEYLKENFPHLFIII